MNGDIESGWQIGIVRADADPDNHAEDEWPTVEEERAALEFAGLKPTECVHEGLGVWICSIPAAWARRAMLDMTAEPGRVIQECNSYTITGPDGRKWTIEVPLP